MLKDSHRKGVAVGLLHKHNVGYVIGSRMLGICSRIKGICGTEEVDYTDQLTFCKTKLYGGKWQEVGQGDIMDSNVWQWAIATSWLVAHGDYSLVSDYKVVFEKNVQTALRTQHTAVTFCVHLV